MAPQPYPIGLLNQAERQPVPPFANTSLQSNSSQTITNIVFGLCALFIGLVTCWQGRRAWIMWHVQDTTPSQHASQQSANPTEVELGQRQVGLTEDSESNHESPSSRTQDGEPPPTPPAAAVELEEVRDTSFQASNGSSHEVSEPLKCASDNERAPCGAKEEPGADESDIAPASRAEDEGLSADTSSAVAPLSAEIEGLRAATSDVALTPRAESEGLSADTSSVARSPS